MRNPFEPFKFFSDWGLNILKRFSPPCDFKIAVGGETNGIPNVWGWIPRGFGWVFGREVFFKKRFKLPKGKEVSKKNLG
ncbi:MAG: hypothetical protein CM15mP111_2750 [Hyphomicrobiales bacterium]|nr:MAG: hypothetical protein CM15mP111_2750 [Hyphomicrobiales bacterium]